MVAWGIEALTATEVAIDTTAGDIQALGAAAAAGSVGKAADAGHVHPNTGVPVIDSTAGDIQALATAAAAGSVGKAADAGHVHPSTGLLPDAASTPVGGYTLINGTGNILTWTAPNDGALHRFTANGTQHVTSTETGGIIQVAFTAPDGTASTFNLFAGGSGAGVTAGTGSRHVQAGTTVTVSQSSALSGGAAKVWIDLWAA
jgi:hypothetical protein